MRIIHITDPHLSSLKNVRVSGLRGKRLLGYQSWYRKRRHQFRSETLHEVTQAIRHEPANLVIVSGDLVHIGLESELREARDWLESVGTPDEVLVTPGNHDCYHPESWPQVQRWYQPYLGSATTEDPAGGYPMLRRADDISIITACSAGPSAWWAASGALGRDQLQRVNNMLLEERDRLRIFVLHHPPLPGMASARKSLKDATELQTILSRSGAEITLHGHLHRNQALEAAHGRIFCTAPASSVVVRRPASYRVFQISTAPDGWRIVMTLKSLIGGEINAIEETGWFVRRTLERQTRQSLDLGQGEHAGT